MSVSDKIKNIFKGIGIFLVVYIVISGNGDDTFFGWILMFVSLVLTVLFLDETKNKLVLSGITIILGAICFRGFVKALPWLALITVLILVYYFVGCGGDINEFNIKILTILNKDNKKLNKSNSYCDLKNNNNKALVWCAFNMLNSFERYYYYNDGNRRLEIKKGIFPFRKINRYSISVLVDTITNMGQEELFWYSVSLPVKQEAKGVEEVNIKHVSRRKIRELDSILNGL